LLQFLLFLRAVNYLRESPVAQLAVELLVGMNELFEEFLAGVAEAFAGDEAVLVSRTFHDLIIKWSIQKLSNQSLLCI